MPDGGWRKGTHRILVEPEMVAELKHLRYFC